MNMDAATEPNFNKEKKNPEMEFTVMPKASASDDLTHDLPVYEDSGKKVWIFAAVTVLVLLGAAFAFYKFKFGGPKTPEIKIPLVNVPPPADEKQDGDEDGLTDEAEAKAATNSKRPDTDGDGLADGDEINVYASDPLLLDTDNDGFQDGREVAGGYSPIAASYERAGALELQSWTDRIAKFGLHEPTPTTLKSRSLGSSGTDKVIYTNVTYGFSIELPKILAFRESQGGREVGIYVAGGQNADEDVSTDPISIAIAISAEDKTLQAFVQEQYGGAPVTEQEVSGLQAVRIADYDGGECKQEKAFFQKESRIIILTRTCIENPQFANLFEQIIQSFKFQ